MIESLVHILNKPFFVHVFNPHIFRTGDTYRYRLSHIICCNDPYPLYLIRACFSLVIRAPADHSHMVCTSWSMHRVSSLQVSPVVIRTSFIRTCFAKRDLYPTDRTDIDPPTRALVQYLSGRSVHQKKDKLLVGQPGGKHEMY